MEAKGPFFIVILVIMLIGARPLRLSDTVICTSDTSVPNNEATISDLQSYDGFIQQDRGVIECDDALSLFPRLEPNLFNSDQDTSKYRSGS